MNKEAMHQKKLNILMVCDGAIDYTAGSFVSTRRYAEQLQRRGNKVVFVTGSIPRPLRGTAHEAFQKEYRGMRVYRFPSLLLPKSESAMLLSLPTLKQMKKILTEEQIDMVHIMGPGPSAYIALRAARALGKKVVMHSHTQPENLFLHVPKRFNALILVANNIFYRYLNWLYRNADLLIYPTEFSKTRLTRIKNDVRWAVISNGVDTDFFKILEDKSFFDRYHVPSNAFKILYVGRLHPEKSVDTLIKAMVHIRAQHPQAHAIIVGAGHLDTTLRQLTERLGLEACVTFTGKIRDEELVRAYNAADVFVLPSLAELEGMVVLEAMACGKPVVVANASESASAHLVRGNGFVFTPEDPEDLALKLSLLITDPALRARMADESKKEILRYDLATCTDVLEEEYHRLFEQDRNEQKTHA